MPSPAIIVAWDIAGGESHPVPDKDKEIMKTNIVHNIHPFTYDIIIQRAHLCSILLIIPVNSSGVVVV